MKAVFRAIIFANRAMRAVIRRSRTAWTGFVYRNALKSCGPGCVIQGGVLIPTPEVIAFGSNCFIWSGVTIMSELEDGHADIGNNVELNRDVMLDMSGGLAIGDHTLISAKAFIFTHDHGYDPKSIPVGHSKIIGEKVWIGQGAKVLEKCQIIGDNAIIAAGSVVTRNVEPNQIVAGNPARVIGTVSEEKRQ